MSARDRVKAGIGNSIANAKGKVLLALGATDEAKEREEEVVVPKTQLKDFDAEQFVRGVVNINRKINRLKDAPAAAHLTLMEQLIPAITEVRATYIAACRAATLRIKEFCKIKKAEAKDLSIKLVRMSLEKLSILIEMEDSIIPCFIYLEIIHALVMFQFAWYLEKKRKDASRLFGGEMKFGNAKKLEDEVVACRRFVSNSRDTIRRYMEMGSTLLPWTLMDQTLETLDLCLRGIPDASVKDMNQWVDLSESMTTNAMSVACLKVNESLLERISGQAVVGKADHPDAVDLEAERESERETLLKRHAIQIVPHIFVLETRKQDINIRLSGGKTAEDLKFLIRKVQLATLGPILRPNRVKHIDTLRKLHTDNDKLELPPELKQLVKSSDAKLWEKTGKETIEFCRDVRDGIKMRLVVREIQLGISEWSKSRPWEIIAAWSDFVGSLLLDSSAPSSGKLPEDVMVWLVLGDTDVLEMMEVDAPIHDPLIGMNQLAQMGDSQENNILTNQVIMEGVHDEENTAEKRQKESEDLKNNYIDKLDSNPLWKLAKLSEEAEKLLDDEKAYQQDIVEDQDPEAKASENRGIKEAHEWLVASSETIRRHLMDESEDIKLHTNNLFGHQLVLKKMTTEADYGKEAKGIFKKFLRLRDWHAQTAARIGYNVFKCCGKSCGRACGGTCKGCCGSCCGLVLVTGCGACCCCVSLSCPDKQQQMVISKEPSQHMIHVSYNLDVMGFNFRDARESAMRMRATFPKISIHIPLIKPTPTASNSATGAPSQSAEALTASSPAGRKAEVSSMPLSDDDNYCYSPTGNFLAHGSQGRFVVRDIPKHFGVDVMDRDFKAKKQGFDASLPAEGQPRVTCIAFSQDEKYVAIGTDNLGVLLWKTNDTEGAVQLKPLGGGIVKDTSGNYPNVSTVAFAPIQKGGVFYVKNLLCFVVTKDDGRSPPKMPKKTDDVALLTAGRVTVYEKCNYGKGAEPQKVALKDEKGKGNLIDDDVNCMSFRPDITSGDLFFVTAGRKGLNVHRFKTGTEGNREKELELLFVLSRDRPLLSCQWAGSVIASSGLNVLQVWDISDEMLNPASLMQSTRSKNDEFEAVKVNIAGIEQLSLDSKSIEVAMCTFGGFDGGDATSVPQLLSAVIRSKAKVAKVDDDKVIIIRIFKSNHKAAKAAKPGTSKNFHALYQRKFEPKRRVLALHFGKGIDRTLSWLFEDRTNENPPKPLYLEHELKGCAPSCCRPFCGSWPEACCFAGCCPGKGCLPGCFPCCSCGPDGRCCWGANACRHSCPTGGMVALEDELGKKIEEKSAAPPYQAFIDRLREESSYAEKSARRHASVPRRVLSNLMKSPSFEDFPADGPGTPHSPAVRTPKKYGSLLLTPSSGELARWRSVDHGAEFEGGEIAMQAKLVGGQMNVDFIGAVQVSQGSAVQACWGCLKTFGVVGRWMPPHILVETQQQIIGKVRTEIAWNRRTSERLNAKLREERTKFVKHVEDAMKKVSSARDSLYLYGVLARYDFTRDATRGNLGRLQVPEVAGNILRPDRYALPRKEILHQARISVYKCGRDLNHLMDAIRRMSRDFFPEEAKKWDTHVKSQKNVWKGQMKAELAKFDKIDESNYTKEALELVDGAWWYESEVIPSPGKTQIASEHPKFARLVKRDHSAFDDCRKACIKARMKFNKYRSEQAPHVGEPYNDKGKFGIKTGWENIWHDSIFLGDDVYYTLAKVIPDKDDRHACLKKWHDEDRKNKACEKMLIPAEQLHQLKDLTQTFLAQLKAATIWHRLANANVNPEGERVQKIQDCKEAISKAIMAMSSDQSIEISSETAVSSDKTVLSEESTVQGSGVKATIERLKHTIERGAINSIKRTILDLRRKTDDLKPVSDNIKGIIGKLKENTPGAAHGTQTEKTDLIDAWEETLKNVNEKKEEFELIITDLAKASKALPSSSTKTKSSNPLENVQEAQVQVSEKPEENGRGGSSVSGAVSSAVDEVSGAGSEEAPEKEGLDVGKVASQVGGSVEGKAEAQDSGSRAASVDPSEERDKFPEEGLAPQHALLMASASYEINDTDDDGKIAEEVEMVCSDALMMQIKSALEEQIKYLVQQCDNTFGIPRHVAVDFKDAKHKVMGELSLVEEMLAKAIQALAPEYERVEFNDEDEASEEAKPGDPDAPDGESADTEGAGDAPDEMSPEVKEEREKNQIEEQEMKKKKGKAKEMVRREKKQAEKDSKFSLKLREALKGLTRRKVAASDILEGFEKRLVELQEPEEYKKLKNNLADCSSKCLSLISWYELSLQKVDWGMHDVDFPEAPWERIEAQLFIDLEDVCNILFFNGQPNEVAPVSSPESSGPGDGVPSDLLPSLPRREPSGLGAESQEEIQKDDVLPFKPVVGRGASSGWAASSPRKNAHDDDDGPSGYAAVGVNTPTRSSWGETRGVVRAMSFDHKEAEKIKSIHHRLAEMMKHLEEEEEKERKSAAGIVREVLIDQKGDGGEQFRKVMEKSNKVEFWLNLWHDLSRDIHDVVAEEKRSNADADGKGKALSLTLYRREVQSQTAVDNEDDFISKLNQVKMFEPYRNAVVDLLECAALPIFQARVVEHFNMMSQQCIKFVNDELGDPAASSSKQGRRVEVIEFMEDAEERVEDAVEAVGNKILQGVGHAFKGSGFGGTQKGVAAPIKGSPSSNDVVESETSQSGVGVAKRDLWSKVVKKKIVNEVKKKQDLHFFVNTVTARKQQQDNSSKKKEKHDLLQLIRHVAQNESYFPKARPAEFFAALKEKDVDRAVLFLKDVYKDTQGFLRDTKVSSSDVAMDKGKDDAGEVAGAEADDLLDMISDEYNEKQLWKVRERALAVLLGIHFDLYFSRRMREKDASEPTNIVLENVDKLITLRKTLEPDEKVRKMANEPKFAFDLRAAVTQKPPLKGELADDNHFATPETFNKSLVAWLHNRIDGLKEVYKDNKDNAYTLQLVEAEKEGIMRQLEQTKKNTSDSKANATMRPTTAAVAVKKGGAARKREGAGDGKVAGDATGSNRNRKREADATGAADAEGAGDDLFADVQQGLTDVEKTMQEVIDPHVERYEDLKKILASIQETNQKNEEKIQEKMKQMQDDTLLKMKQHIKEAMESTVESAVRVVGADSLKTHITEEISKIKVSGGGVSGEELEELLDSVPIQRMNKEVEKLTGRIERSNEQTKNMLRKNEAMMKLMGHSPMHWAKQDNLHGIKKKLNSIAKEQDRAVRAVSPNFAKEGGESWSAYLTKVADVSSQLDRLRRDMQIEMEEQRDALDDMHGMLVTEFQGTTIHLPPNIFKDTIINAPAIPSFTKTKSSSTRRTDSDATWANNHLTSSPLTPRASRSASRGLGV